MTALRLCITILALAPAAHAQSQESPDKASMSGNWVLNLARSDDAREQLDRASGGGLVVVRGRGSAARNPDQVASVDREETRLAIEELTMSGAMLQLLVTESTVQVQSERQLLKLNSDGKAQLIARWGNPQLNAKAEWKKEKLVLETIAGDGLTLREEFELKQKDGATQLEVLTQLRMQGGRLVRVKRVYDRKV
jgi:hypothetical protein